MDANNELHTWAAAALRELLKRCVRAIATEAAITARLQEEKRP